MHVHGETLYRCYTVKCYSLFLKISLKSLKTMPRKLTKAISTTVLMILRAVPTKSKCSLIQYERIMFPHSLFCESAFFKQYALSIFLCLHR